MDINVLLLKTMFNLDMNNIRCSWIHDSNKNACFISASNLYYIILSAGQDDVCNHISFFKRNNPDDYEIINREGMIKLMNDINNNNATTNENIYSQYCYLSDLDLTAKYISNSILWLINNHKC